MNPDNNMNESEYRLTRVEQTGVPDASPSMPALDVGALLDTLRRKAWIIALCGIVPAVLLYLYSLTKPNIYKSTATIEVEQVSRDPMRVPGGKELEDYKSLEVLRTFEQRLASRALMKKVIGLYNLASDPRFAPPKKNGKPYTEVELVDIMQKKVKVGLRRGTRLIDLSVEYEDAATAKDLAQSFINEFIRLGFDKNVSFSKMAKGFLLQEASRLKEQLKTSEAALHAYREEHKAVSLEDKQNIIVEKLKELNLQVTKAKANRLRLEADAEKMRTSGYENAEELLKLASIASLPAVIEMQKQISQKEAEFARVKERYLYKHPKFKEANSQLGEARTTMHRLVLEAGRSIQQTYEGAYDTEKRLAEALTQQEELALQLNKIAIPYNVLLREVQGDRALYESVVKQLKEANVTDDMKRTVLTMAEPPEIASKKSKPRRKVMALLAMIFGLFAGTGTVLTKSLLDRSLRTVDQAERALKLPALATVPRGKASGAALALNNDKNTAEAEAFRTLRTQLTLVGSEKPVRSVLFTSARAAEGKSYCAANYAVALAKQGYRTLLIDADLRRPGLDKLVMNSEQDTGLANFLVGQGEPGEACHFTGIDNLYLIPAGLVNANPAELLGCHRLKELMDDARLWFHRIVIDSAPVNPVSDAVLLAKETDGVCMVVKAGKTPAGEVQRACASLTRAGTPPLGFVLNQTSPEIGSREYSYAEYQADLDGAIPTPPSSGMKLLEG